ncbi:MAG: hypothetical protein Ct9H90mP16_04900 [Candidatus Poseidoniales archaeon]|nr:MAG: hypothetical protein Ct9H90mP16_04900 [Candidatus Poseidoniales archaeon]
MTPTTSRALVRRPPQLQSTRQGRRGCADRDGAFGAAQANRDRDIQVAENGLKPRRVRRPQADQRIFVQGQEALAIEGENNSKASIAE